MLIYLYGFRSAPQSIKARQLEAAMARRNLAAQFHCPTQSLEPAKVIQQIDALVASKPDAEPLLLVGSSLGGHFATCAAEKHDCSAVLINPSVISHVSLVAYLGEQQNMYTGERFILTTRHIEQLSEQYIATLSRPEKYWLLVETGDEVLDYRHAVTRYHGARQSVLADGDHSFTRWPDFVDDVVEHYLSATGNR